eukprot:scaffold44895_cov18-Prasinocladus_malaysianus.AAC.1
MFLEADITSRHCCNHKPSILTYQRLSRHAWAPHDDDVKLCVVMVPGAAKLTCENYHIIAAGFHLPVANFGFVLGSAPLP